MPSYSLYGLRLSSNQSIPGLAESSVDGATDLQIWLGQMPRHMHELRASGKIWYVSEQLAGNDAPGLILRESADGRFFLIRYSDGTEFLFDQDERQIWAAWPEGLTLEDTAIYLLGPVMGVVLYLQGIVCLHAGAVAIDDCAVAIVGCSGAGKSTTAAAFARLGYRVLSDNVVTLSEQDDDLIVYPAYPCIRLWPSSVRLLYGAEDALPLLTPTWDKRGLHLIDRGYKFAATPLPLAAVYLLGDRSPDSSAPLAEALTSQETMISLLANTYANYLPGKNGRAREFKVLGRLAARMPVRRVIPHENPDYLFRLCQVIVDDFRLNGTMTLGGKREYGTNGIDGIDGIDGIEGVTAEPG